MVWAPELLRAALRLGHDRRGMMPANVVEPAQLSVISPRHYNWLAPKVRGEKTPLLPHLIGAPHHLPRFRKHALLLEFVDPRIEIPRRRNCPSVIQRIIRIVEIQQLSNIVFHHSSPSLPPKTSSY